MDTKNIYQEKRREFDELFKDIDDAKLKEKNKEVLDMLDFVNKRIDYTEQRRFGYLQIGIAMVAFSGAGGAIIAVFLNTEQNTAIANVLLGFLYPFVIGFFITGLCMVRKYNVQTNPRYPFIDTDVTKTWKWFYHYMDVKKLGTKIKYSEEEHQQYNQEYLNKMGEYANKLIKEDKKEELKQNTEQLYLFLILEKYKNDFTRQLQGIFYSGIKRTMRTSIIILVIVSLIISGAAQTIWTKGKDIYQKITTQEKVQEKK